MVCDYDMAYLSEKLRCDFIIKGVQDYALRDGLGIEKKPTIV